MEQNDFEDDIKFRHNKFSWCQQRLLPKDECVFINQFGFGGIDIIKYNYSNYNKQRVNLWFSSDFKQFYWKSLDKKLNIMAECCKLSDI